MDSLINNFVKALKNTPAASAPENEENFEVTSPSTDPDRNETTTTEVIEDVGNVIIVSETFSKLASDDRQDELFLEKHVFEKCNENDDNEGITDGAELVGLLFDDNFDREDQTVNELIDGNGKSSPSLELVSKITENERILDLDEQICIVSDETVLQEMGDEDDNIDNSPGAYHFGNDYYEDNSESLMSEKSNCEERFGGEAISTVKYFSPREVHNGKVIGEGGFGRVLKGSLHSGTPVAIKLFHAPLIITSELDSLLNLKHKNIVTVFGIVHQADEVDCPQLVLQYISEGSVLQYLSRHDNPEDNSTLGKIALDVVEGCQFLQEHGIIHGNLAARNILVERVVGRHKTYYNAKISDVGFIRFAEVSGGNYMKIPGSNDRFVPVRWVPKEIVDEQEDGTVGSEFSFASDVWSFGVVLWEIWTRGAIPYGASYSNLRVLQFLKDGYSPLKVHRPTECPTKVVNMMESIFQINPNERPSFDEIHTQFVKYKGHGKEHKPSKAFSAKMSTTSAKEMSPSSSATADFREDREQQQIDIVKDAAFTKKKRNKKSKKLDTGKPGVSGPIAAQEVDGSSSPLQRPLNPHCQQTDTTITTDSTIAALLKRVNQLEKERRGGHRGGRGAGVIKSSFWQQRLGPPRFNRNDRGGGYLGRREYNDVGGISSSVQIRSAVSPISPPPPSSYAPPPYTEVPLPYHSSSRFSAQSPEYDYGHGRANPGPSSSRGVDAVRAGYHGNGNSTALRGPAGACGGEEDFIRKIKRLAEEIEFLRAEKMTQELLKKSAELADTMKLVTTERRDTSGVAPGESRYAVAAESHTSRTMSTRHVVVRGRDQYNQYPEEDYEDYHYDGQGNGDRWISRQSHQRDHHHSHNVTSPGQPHHHRGGSNANNSPRRPYYKGRGLGSSHRGHYNNNNHNNNNGRYDDRNGGGSFGKSSYGN